mmetsp:Transcript_9833/g.27287  ORF Transcript_9833/g.27287 Transcript_9833/m.27287 type:complete len:330 (-) Transcript_9833:188-1177(-)|eukprot:CAMPEP_0168742070 /NCGR_PEP_ID=MMETSP0724-20121128/12847_1 /TAXON_ID=265536 /ORGANISM="Amphiprora sp., Strain CCMP467" /LENGTH=329 /DNA_ID=CAMNT_0008789609 /DNA_START=136 /DNA_END=1125 /DNA_ORIENTATION=-
MDRKVDAARKRGSAAEASLGSSMPSLAEYTSDGESMFDDRSVITRDTSTQDKGFQNKVIVITGAGGQFGRAGCIYFARRGARIAGLDRDRDTLKETFMAMEKELGNGAFDYKPYVCDVTDAKQVDGVIGSVFLRFKRIDLLWNNAGYQGKIKPMLNYDPEDFKLVMEINVAGLFIVMQAVGKRMKEQGDDEHSKGECAIVNTAAAAGQRGTPAMIAYSASKAAVLSMTTVAAKELAQYGIRVNCISPALIGPGFMWERENKLHARVGAPFFPSRQEEVANSKIQTVPMKRLGEVDEVLNTVHFLLSKQASYITGTNIDVDGGMTTGMRA